MDTRFVGVLTVLVLVLTLATMDCKVIEADSNTDNDDHTFQEIQLHVITKRDTGSDIHQDYPKVDGRTFRASAPLDPSKPSESKTPSEVSSFEDFDTVNRIFTPEVEEGGVQETDTRAEQYKDQVAAIEAEGQDEESASETDRPNSRQKASDETEKDESEKVKQTEEAAYSQPQSDDGRRYGYGAQDPYAHTSATGEDYARTRTYAVSGASGGASRDADRTSSGDRMTRTRIAVTGSGPGRDGGESSGYDSRSYDNQRRTQTYSGSSSSGQSQPTQSRPSYPASNTRTRTRSQGNDQYYYYPSNSQARTQDRSRTQYRTSSTSRERTEERGHPYTGPRYVDNNGHFIDRHGRHLDSTGRYYDVSGRYSNARVTHTATYSGSSRPSNYRTAPEQTGYETRGSNQYTNQYTASGGSDGTPVDSYGGTRFYSGGNSYPQTYNPVTSQISSDPTCAATNTVVTINGVPCATAVSSIGHYVCYNYERVSSECCETCLQVKRSTVGCEYGDRSSECRNIEAHSCYNERNRELCCERCEQLRQQFAPQAQPGCDWGDRSPRCDEVRQRPFLCYNPENQRTCCQTCPRVSNGDRTECQWGDQNPELCEPFDSNGRLQVNCYIPELRRICCSTCTNLADRIREPIANCEFGDWPILYSNGRQQFNCMEYIREYGFNSCNDWQLSEKCCYTCHRYRTARARG